MSQPRQKATEQEAAALTSAVRLRILRLTADEPLTNRQLAERLDRDPASTLRHVRMLVDLGFLAAQPARRGQRGAREIPYRATGKSWLIDLDDYSPTPIGNAMLEAFLAELHESGNEFEGQVRAALWMSDDERREFGDKLVALVEEFRSRGKRDGTTHWSLFTAMHRQ